jgi:hypothetical protein
MNMKAIINGKRYDTEKAILIGEASSRGMSVNDFGHWYAGLYRTPKAGRYFLAGEGGPMTRWARPVGNNGRTGGEGIFEFEPEEALEWAERYLDADAIEKHFGEMVEDA